MAMEAKTLTPDADAEADAAAAAAAQTLAAGELVWVKPSKPRRHSWWPARMLAACPATGTAARDAQVRYFGGPGAGAASPGCAPSAPPAQVRRFADPDADAMARGSVARVFLAAVEEAHATAVAALRAQLTCGCVPPPPPGEEEGGVGVVAEVANLAPAEFLAALREAALGMRASPVGLVDRARLKSWARAFGEGWGPDGALHYPRRPLEDLVDKIDLDVPAGEDRDADDWLAEDEREPLKRPLETPVQKKRSVTSVVKDLDRGEDEDQSDSPGTVTSGKRERKKSKYLSPPYTNVGVAVAVLPRKSVGTPKASVPKAAEDGSKVLQSPDSIVVEDVLLLVRGLGKDPHNMVIFPEAAEGLLRLFRGSTFVEGDDYASYNMHKCPEVRTLRNASMNISPGQISGPHPNLEQDKRVPKRGRKKDGDGSGGSSIKRKKRENTSPAFGSGMPITPAIPIRQVKAEDIRTLRKAGNSARGIVQDEKNKLSPFKCPVTATVPEAAKPGHEQVQENDKSVLEKPQAMGNTLPEGTAKGIDEAKLDTIKSETNVQNVVVGVPVGNVQTETTESEASIHIDVNAQTIDADVPVECVSKEATELEARVHCDKNVQGDVTGVLKRIVSKEATESEVDTSIDENVQSALAGVPDGSVSKEATKSEANIHIVENLLCAIADAPISSGPSPMHDDMAQPQLIDENKEPGSVEVRTVQQSYASLQALVPEMLKKGNTNGTDVIAMNNTLKEECPKDESPVQKVKLPAGAASNHSSGEAVNGTCPDPANRTPNKRKKKTVQHFENPAAILVQFTPGVIVPSREELLSTFGKYGYLIESRTEIVKADCSARVVFGKSIEAEAAYRDRELLGQFGAPFATLSLQYLPPIKLSMPSSPSPSPSPSLASKPPLTDIRKNLEMMIAARLSALNKPTSSDGLNSVSDKLLGDMQGLLANVDKILSKPSANNAP